MTEIASVRAVFSEDKAIRSEDHRGTTWFYRQDFASVLAHRDGDTYAVDMHVVERNVDSDSTEVETVPVADSPFGGD